jgi:ankyrin repeat protein
MTPELNDSLTTMASAGKVDEMRILLMAGQEPLPKETIQNLLETAVKHSHLDVVNFLLNEYPPVSLNEEIVRAAIYTRSIRIFKTLLTQDPSVINMQFDHRGTPLIVACLSQQTLEFLRLLLEAGADPNQDPDVASYPLALVATFYTDPAAIDLLLQYGARLEESGALRAAAQKGNEPMIRRLLDRGARQDTDTPAPGMGIGTLESPLYAAVKKGHAGVARILMQHGANPNANEAFGGTAMEVARSMRREGKDMEEMIGILGGD